MPWRLSEDSRLYFVLRFPGFGTHRMCSVYSAHKSSISCSRKAKGEQPWAFVSLVLGVLRARGFWRRTFWRWRLCSVLSLLQLSMKLSLEGTGCFLTNVWFFCACSTRWTLLATSTTTGQRCGGLPTGPSLRTATGRRWVWAHPIHLHMVGGISAGCQGLKLFMEMLSSLPCVTSARPVCFKTQLEM